MTKDELIYRIANEANITQKAADIALKTLLNAITEAVCQGNRISFTGFGTFGVKERKARTGIHPKTKETITIKAAKVPYFKPSEKLKEKAN